VQEVSKSKTRCSPVNQVKRKRRTKKKRVVAHYNGNEVKDLKRRKKEGQRRVLHTYSAIKNILSFD